MMRAPKPSVLTAEEIQRAKAGDPDAQGELLTRALHAAKAELLELATTFGGDSEEANQHYLANLLAKLARFEGPPGSFAPWARRMAWFTLKEQNRLKGLRPPSESLNPEQEGWAGHTSRHGAAFKSLPEPDHTDPIVSRAMREEQAEALLEAVASLPPKYRDVIRRTLDGETPTEIGAALGITANAAAVQALRARRILEGTLHSLRGL